MKSLSWCILVLAVTVSSSAPLDELSRKVEAGRMSDKIVPVISMEQSQLSPGIRVDAPVERAAMDQSQLSPGIPVDARAKKGKKKCKGCRCHGCGKRVAMQPRLARQSQLA